MTRVAPVIVVALWCSLGLLVPGSEGAPEHKPEKGYEEFNQQLDSLRQRLLERTELKKAADQHTQALREAQAEAKRIVSQHLLAEALNAYQQGDAATATERFQQVLFLEPKNRKAKQALQQLAQQGAPSGVTGSEARISPRALEEAKTDERKDRLQRAQQLLKAGNFEAAVSAFQEVLGLAPSNRQAQEGLAQARREISKQTQQAAQPTVQPKPTALNERFQAALSRLETGDYLQAQQAFLALLQEVKQHKQEAQARAAIEETKERIKSSSAEVVTAISQAQFAQTEKNLLDILDSIKILATQKKQAAEQHKLQADVATHMELALKYLDREDYPAAKAELQKVLPLEPSHPHALALAEKVSEVMAILGAKRE